MEVVKLCDIFIVASLLVKIVNVKKFLKKKEVHFQKFKNVCSEEICKHLQTILNVLF